jgi:hypothetical protein
MPYGHWQGLVLFLEAGRLELDTNTVERAIPFGYPCHHDHGT